jgi:hypothetical protein
MYNNSSSIVRWLLLATLFAAPAQAGVVEGLVWSNGGPKFHQAIGAEVTLVNTKTGRTYSATANRRLPLAGRYYNSCYRFGNVASGQYVMTVSYWNLTTRRWEKERLVLIGAVTPTSYRLTNPTTR